MRRIHARRGGASSGGAGPEVSPARAPEPCPVAARSVSVTRRHLPLFPYPAAMGTARMLVARYASIACRSAPAHYGPVLGLA